MLFTMNMAEPQVLQYWIVHIRKISLFSKWHITADRRQGGKMQIQGKTSMKINPTLQEINPTK